MFFKSANHELRSLLILRKIRQINGFSYVEFHVHCFQIRLGGRPNTAKIFGFRVIFYDFETNAAVTKDDISS
jgi:hypothetical protein